MKIREQQNMQHAGMRDDTQRDMSGPTTVQSSQFTECQLVTRRSAAGSTVFNMFDLFADPKKELQSVSSARLSRIRVLCLYDYVCGSGNVRARRAAKVCHLCATVSNPCYVSMYVGLEM